MQRDKASFRDPSGYVLYDQDKLIRNINPIYCEQWQAVASSRLLERKEFFITFHEVSPYHGAWKSLDVEKIPFISYPYEWCFGQLKDAALLTLDIQKEALQNKLTLKDASAYNIQYIGKNPIFIDLLSLEQRKNGTPWAAYRQFCMHFLSPLTLMSYTDIHLGSLLRLYIDGIPLNLTSKLLPMSSLLHINLLIHIYIHAYMEKKYSNFSKGSGESKKANMSENALLSMIISLRSIIESLNLPINKTEWSEYYKDTNYSEEAANFKYNYIQRKAEKSGGGLAIDLGANIGRYSRILAPYFCYVLAPDMDLTAVEFHYQALRKDGPANILPLVLDLSNPSPSQGWGEEERLSFAQRCRADWLSALALIHHLRITAGIPLSIAAEYFSRLLIPGGCLLLEFVPKEDSQVKRLLATREDIFDDYTLDSLLYAFAEKFQHEETVDIPESERKLIFFLLK
jgi:SAM-dependent methyltransferase